MTTNLEGSQISEESTAVPYGANFLKSLYDTASAGVVYNYMTAVTDNVVWKPDVCF